jgi:hypothetical protein
MMSIDSPVACKQPLCVATLDHTVDLAPQESPCSADMAAITQVNLLEPMLEGV